jgi:hypothetical protein
MKFKIGAISCVIFISLCFGAALYQDSQKKNKYMFKVPTVEEIVSAEIHIGGKPPTNKGPIQMDLSNNMQKMTVAKILYWLTHAEHAEYTHNQIIPQGGKTYEFVMKTKDGNSIGFVDAFDPISITISNGWMTTALSVRDQVTITYDDNKILRLKSPELKFWIETEMSKMVEDRLKELQK